MFYYRLFINVFRLVAAETPNIFMLLVPKFTGKLFALIEVLDRSEEKNRNFTM